MQIIFSILLLSVLAFVVTAQNKPETYSETKELLLKMERCTPNKQLIQLFNKADLRMPDLIQALDEPEKLVSLNAQIIINYLAEPEGLKAIEDWKNRQPRNYSIPKMKLLSEEIYLAGSNSTLVNLVRQNINLFEAARYDDEDISVRLIGYNRRTKTALLEIVKGQTFTAGWHSVIKFEAGKWRLVSDSNIWVS